MRLSTTKSPEDGNEYTVFFSLEAMTHLAAKAFEED
jgi:hypothetical protein